MAALQPQRLEDFSPISNRMLVSRPSLIFNDQAFNRSSNYWCSVVTGLWLPLFITAIPCSSFWQSGVDGGSKLKSSQGAKPGSRPAKPVHACSAIDHVVGMTGSEKSRDREQWGGQGPCLARTCSLAHSFKVSSVNPTMAIGEHFAS